MKVLTTFKNSPDLKLQIAWFDTGTHRRLLDADTLVDDIQTSQGQYVACIE